MSGPATPTARRRQGAPLLFCQHCGETHLGSAGKSCSSSETVTGGEKQALHARAVGEYRQNDLERQTRAGLRSERVSYVADHPGGSLYFSHFGTYPESRSLPVF